jgi:hypothetical protein
MTTTLRTTTERVPMDSMRKTALVAGIFYLITFISIPTLALYSQRRPPPWILIEFRPKTPTRRSHLTAAGPILIAAVAFCSP